MSDTIYLLMLNEEYERSVTGFTYDRDKAEAWVAKRPPRFDYTTWHSYKSVSEIKDKGESI